MLYTTHYQAIISILSIRIDIVLAFHRFESLQNAHSRIIFAPSFESHRAPASIVQWDVSLGKPPPPKGSILSF